MNASDFDNLISSERLILIDFYASWCGACRAIDHAIERVALSMSDIVTIVRIDTSSASSTEIVKRYNIVALPTLILFCRGELIWRECGIISYDRLSAVIRRYKRVGAY